MKQLIGFATQYYTLWNYENIPQYKTDAYGNHHQVGTVHKFYYIKNISTDLEKVKSLYPTLEIDNELRGKTRSFEYEKTTPLPDNYFWAGKYAGRLVDEIITSDFKYCVWSADNYGGPTSEYIKNHPTYIEYFAKIEADKQEIISNTNTLNIGDEVELAFLTNGYNADDDYTECWAKATFGDVEVRVKFNGARLVSGIYPYIMPVINGKSQKTKNKTIKVKITDVLNTQIEFGNVVQHVIIQ